MAVAFCVIASGCKKKEVEVTKAVDKPIKVQTVLAETAKMPRYLTLTGSVFAEKQSSVAANVTGRITSTLVERGSVVQKGQVIAIVDSKQAGFSAQAAVGQYQAAEAQVTLAKQECERADKLFASGAFSQAEFDRAKSQCSAQLGTASAARANADLAGKLAADTLIRSPIDGVIGERKINVGEFVTTSTMVATVYAVNPVRISISVPEVAVGLVQKGQQLNVKVSAYPGRRFPAVVEFVSPALRENTRDLIVEAKAHNDDLALKPGMFATVELSVGEEERTVVPALAVRTEGSVKRVFLAKDKQAYEVVVRTGVTKDGLIALLDPLQAGTNVIVSPPPGLRDGQAIE